MYRRKFDCEENLISNKLYSKIGKLIKLMDELNDIGILNELQLNKIYVLGESQSGKSTIIQSLIGIDWLNSVYNVNNRIIEIRLVHAKQNGQFYVRFPREEKNEEKYTDFEEIKNKYNEYINKKDNNSLFIEITHIKYPNLLIIEVPQNKTIDYAKENDNTIFIVNIPAQYATSQEELNIYEPFNMLNQNLDRTIGVITKIDTLEPGQNVKKVLQNDFEKKLKYGFVGVKLGSTTQLNTGYISLQNTFIKETEYFHTHNVYRYMNLQSFFSIDSIAEKLKKMFFDNQNLVKLLCKVSAELKVKTQQCQNELEKFGTDYISYENSNKSTYITSLINIYVDTLERLFSGKMLSTNTQNVAHFNLKSLYYDFLLNEKSDNNPSDKITNSDIIKIIKLTEGDRLSGFPEGEVIYALLENEFDNLREKIREYMSKIHDTTISAVNEILLKIFCRYPKLMDKMEELMTQFMENV